MPPRQDARRGDPLVLAGGILGEEFCVSGGKVTKSILCVVSKQEGGVEAKTERCPTEKTTSLKGHLQGRKAAELRC